MRGRGSGGGGFYTNGGDGYSSCSPGLAFTNGGAGGDNYHSYGGEGGFGSTPAYHKGVVYIGGWDSNVYAINAYTGKQIWRYKTGNDIESSPCIANDTDEYVFWAEVDFFIKNFR